MSNTYKQPGEVIDHTPSADVASGDLVRIGKRAGVASVDIASGETGSVSVAGVHEVPKLASDDMAQGDEVYLDHVNKRVQLATGDDGGSPAIAFVKAGYVFEAAAAATTTVLVKLNG